MHMTSPQPDATHAHASLLPHASHPPPPPGSPRSSGGGGGGPFSGVHALLLSLAAVWAATGPLGLLPPAALALDRSRWLTVLTDAWLSPGADYLARNLFFGYMFGRAVDNVEGSGGLWITYTLSAAGECDHSNTVCVAYALSAAPSLFNLQLTVRGGGCASQACAAMQLL